MQLANDHFARSPPLRIWLERRQISLVLNYTTMGKNSADNVVAVDYHTEFPFHAKTIEECFAELKITDPDFRKKGLTTEEAQKRLALYGPNKLSEKEKVTIWQRIWKQVANVLVGILVFVAGVSLAQAIRYSIEGGESQNVVTNSIQVGLIITVIT